MWLIFTAMSVIGLVGWRWIDYTDRRTWRKFVELHFGGDYKRAKAWESAYLKKEAGKKV